MTQDRGVTTPSQDSMAAQRDPAEGAPAEPDPTAEVSPGPGPSSSTEPVEGADT